MVKVILLLVFSIVSIALNEGQLDMFLLGGKAGSDDA